MNLIKNNVLTTSLSSTWQHWEEQPENLPNLCSVDPWHWDCQGNLRKTPGNPPLAGTEQRPEIFSDLGPLLLIMFKRHLDSALIFG